jgi:flagellar biogenesis protein FliO
MQFQVGIALLVGGLAVSAGPQKPAANIKTITDDGNAAPKAVDAAALGTLIGDIETEITETQAFITIRLNRPLSEVPLIEDHNSFLQLRLPATLVPESGKFYSTELEQVPKLAVFQVTDSDAAVRLFLNGQPGAIMKAAKIDQLGNQLVVSIDRKSLAAAVKADEIVSKTKVGTDSPPSEVLKAEAPVAESNILYEKAQTVAIFLGILVGGLAILYLARPIFRRRIRAAAALNEAVTDMRTISTLPLAARQKLSLVQIGDRKILLGVTPENISFLTSIDPPQKFAAASAADAAYQRRQYSAPVEQFVSKQRVEHESEQPKLERKPRVNVQPKAPSPGEGATSKTSQMNDALASEDTIGDVTRLIREKMKSLPRI